MGWRRRLAKASRSGVFAPVLGPALRLDVLRYRLRLRDLARPLRLVIVTDLHFDFGPSTARRAAQLRRRVMACSPDMVLFLGDIAGGVPGFSKARRVDAGCAALAGYSAPLGCFAILGNHDWNDDAAARARGGGPNRATALLQSQGWHVLENANARVDTSKGPIWIAGLASQRAFVRGVAPFRRHTGLHDVDRALTGIPPDAPVILMAHEPDVFPDLPDREMLVLSGHTHAGQIRILGRPLVASSRHGTTYAHGHFQDGARQLLVSAGLGCSTIPLRIATVPELTVIEMTP